MKGFRHTATEIYEDLDGSLRQCDDSGEDPSCAGHWTWKWWVWSWPEHRVYLGHNVVDMLHCDKYSWADSDVV
jgi:hypothetical protein